MIVVLNFHKEQKEIKNKTVSITKDGSIKKVSRNNTSANLKIQIEQKKTALKNAVFM